MPTIEELFKSKKLANGQTAQQQYDIRNTADLRRTPYNVLMTPSFRIAEIGRRNVTNTKKETRLEEELSGLRILSTTTSPFIYGTDIIKFTTKSRGIVDDMKSGAKGVSNGGILTTFLNKAENLGNNLLSKIGAKLPEQLIPSRIALNKDFGTIGPLGDGAKPGGEYVTMIRLQKIKSAGAGNFLGKVLANNLQGRPNENQIIGSALEIGKKALNKLLLGSPSEAAQLKAKLGDIGTTSVYASNFPYSKVVLPWVDSDTIEIRDDLSSKYVVFPQKAIVGDNYPAGPYIRPNVIKTPKTKFSTNADRIPNSIEVKRGMYTTSDYLNKQVSYPSSTGLKNDLIGETEKQLDNYDFVTLKFWSVAKKAAVNFRATISGLSETISPSWDTNRFIGNPFNFYTYNSIERSVTFNFKVYSLSDDEHISAWQRLNFLTSLAYPQEYTNLAVVPPFIKFTLGDMFRNKESYIDSLTYTIDDNVPWEIGLEAGTKDWKLPKIISVDITLKLVETIGSTYKKRLYGYGDVPVNVPIKQDGNKELNADGSPKKKEAGETTDVKKDGEVQNPSEKKPEPPEDPKGSLLTEYKGYKIYTKKDLFGNVLSSYKGDAIFHKGNESSAAAAVLLDIEKRYIDSNIDNQRRANQDQAEKEGLTAAQFFAKYPDRKTGQENG